jgi:hypothetical protein
MSEATCVERPLFYGFNPLPAALVMQGLVDVGRMGCSSLLFLLNSLGTVGFIILSFKVYFP